LTSYCLKKASGEQKAPLWRLFPYNLSTIAGKTTPETLHNWMQLLYFLYPNGRNKPYMHTTRHLHYQNFEQYPLRADILGEYTGFLKEEMAVKLTFYGTEALDVELPTTVDLKIIQADVAVRGDTATGVTKNVTVETGVQVQVPNFVNEGDTIRVDTRTGTYVTRVQ